MKSLDYHLDHKMSASAAVGQKSVALIHGWGGSSASVWDANGWSIRLSEAGYLPLPIDLLGHGTARRSYEPADYADLAGHVSHNLPSTPLNAIGFSLGAKILLEIAAREPKRFLGLVLGGLGANAFAPERLAIAVADALEQGCRADTSPPVRALVEYGLSSGNDARSIAACLRRPPNPVLTPPRLKGISCPVMLVAGDKDAVAMPVEPLADSLAEPMIILLEGVDHLHLPQSEAFASAALEFLARQKAMI